MLSKFSVKKPMTVFVCVILVIVLGVVSFTRMTPDLLPNMDFPYVMIMTTYPGQTPETVEAEVTRPLESSLSTIDGVKEITSTSADNYSMVIIEFEDGTNMDTATVDLRSGLDTVSDSWGDAIGTPYMIKVNPNILPVAMIAVDYEGKGRKDISSFVSDELLNKLEGIDGVASVSDRGVVEEKEKIVVSQKKIDELNKKISAALDSQFAKAEDKINKAKKELDENIAQAESGAGTISSSLEEINTQQEEAAKQLAAAQTEADNGRTQLLSAKMELLDNKASLTRTKTLLETSYKALLEIKTTYDKLLESKAELGETIEFLNAASEEYKEVMARLYSPDVSAEEKKQLDAQLEELDKRLKPYNTTKEKLTLAITAANIALSRVDSSVTELNEKLKEFGTDAETLDSTMNTVTENISGINEGIEQLDTAISGLDDKSVTVNEALALISQQQSGADFKMSAAVSNLTAKQSEVAAAAAQLSAAEQELEKSVEEISTQKKAAKDKADANSMVTIENVSGILTAQNFSMPAGYVTDDENNKYMVRVGDEIADENELEKLALFDTKIDGIGVIHLNDVADIFAADNADDIYAKINGRDGVVLSFTKSSNIATAKVCDNINKEIKTLEEKYEGLTFTSLYSQGDYIDIIINSVLQNLLMGAVLAIIILYIFLRDIKPTVIVACSIPISVIFAVVLMYFSGISLNMLSLSGLAIGVGMLVDNSVVVIENIYRLRGLGYSAVKAAVNGAKQVAGAIAASTLTTVCVFAPIVFVEGITRQLFVDMALTIAYSLLASLIVALTLVPAMSQRMLRKIKPQKDINSSRILRAYEKSLRFVLRHKIVSVIVAIALLFGSTLGALAKGFSFMPGMSSTEIQLSVSLEDNATFEDTVKVAEEVNAILVKHDEFETVGVMVGGTSSLIGLSANLGSNGAGGVTAYGVLKDNETKNSDKITEEITAETEDIKGTVTVGSGTASSMSTLLGNGSVEMYLYGDDLKQLQSTAKDVAEKLDTLDCFEMVDDGIGDTSPEIQVSVNKLKAAEKGLTVAQVFQQVAQSVSNEKTSTTLKTSGGKSVDIVVVKDESKQIAPDDIGKIMLSYTDAEGNDKKTSLSSIAEVTRAETMDIVSRKNQKRFLTISGNIKDDVTLTQAANEAKSLVADYKFPSGITSEFTGSDETTMEAIGQLMLMLLVGVIMIYLIMVAQFQSLKSPFIIMFTIPLAFTGGFLALLITGFDVSVVSLIGFIMLCGIIVNNGIVLVDYINRLRQDGRERLEAIIEAGKTRMRPIFITALTTVLGLSVMAFGIGTGAEMMQPLAIVCIGGLLYATLMTLYIVPAIYDMMNKKELRKISDEELAEIDE